MERSSAQKIQKKPARARQLQAQSAGSSSRAHPLLELQRSIGNQAVQRLINSPYIQTKLQVSTPGDPYEQEADRVADTVMRMPEKLGLFPQAEEEEKTVATKLPTDAPLQRQAREDDEREEETRQTSPIQRQTEDAEEEKVQTKPLSGRLSPSLRIHSVQRSASDVIQRLCTQCEDEKQQDYEQSGGMVHRKAAPEQPPHDDDDDEEEQVQPKGAQTATPNIPTSVAANIHAMNGGGSPLPETTRAFFEPRFGADLSNVRVHTDSRAAETARSINAKAFTVGRDIAFGAGQYEPHSQAGQRLLAHELTHTIQQGANTDSSFGQSTSSNSQITGTPPQSHSQAAPSAYELGDVVQRTAQTFVQRQTGSEDRIAVIQTQLAARQATEAIVTMGSLTPDEVVSVLSDAVLKRLAVRAFNSKQMGKAVVAMHGPAVPSLHWLLAAECGWAEIGTFLRSNPPDIEVVLGYISIRNGFVDALGDSEMANALLLLPGSLTVKMLWLREEGAGYDEAVAVIDAAPKAERPALYDNPILRDWFVDICDDILMKNLVLLHIGGTLRQQLGWMKAEGSSWRLLSEVLAKAPQDQKAALLGDAEIRTFFQETLNDYEMKWAVDMLGGPLSQQMEWLQAEDSTEAPAAAERAPSLSEQDIRLLNQLEGRGPLLLRFREYQTALIGRALGAQQLKISEPAERLGWAEAALEAELEAEGFDSINGFLDEIRRFEALFVGFGLQTAFAMLADNRRIAEQERDRYAGNEGVELMSFLQQQFRPKQYHPDAVYNQLSAIYSPFNDATPLAFKAGTYPILAHPGFYTNITDIVNAHNLNALREHVAAVADRVIGNISETRDSLLSDTEKLWQLDNVITQAKQMMGIAKPSVFDSLIQGKLDQISADKTFKSIALGALAIGLGLVSGGAGAVAVLAAAGSLTISAVTAIESWKQHAFTSAAHGSAIDPARALSQVEPSAVWLAVDVLGAFLDLGGFAKAINQLGKPAQAVIKSGEGAARSVHVAELKKEAHVVASELRVGQDIVSEEAFVGSVVVSAERHAQQKAVLATKPELTQLVTSRVRALANDEAALSGLVALGDDTLKSVLQAFGDNPELLRRLGMLSESQPAIASAISRLHIGLGDQAFGNVLSDVLMRRDPGRAKALVSAMVADRLTEEQLHRLAKAGSQADEGARSRAIAQEIDKTLTEATGSAAHGSAAQTKALERTRALEAEALNKSDNPAEELVDEWNYVQGSQPIPLTENEYIAEVMLPNGHRWKQNRLGRWCRFTSEFCLTEGATKQLTGGTILETQLGPEAAKRLSQLGPDAVGKITALDPSSLKRIAHLDQATIEKFAQLDPQALAYVAGLNPAALEWLASLKSDAVAKIASAQVTSPFALRKLAEKIGPRSSAKAIDKALAKAERHRALFQKGVSAAEAGDWSRISGKERSSIGRHIGYEVEELARVIASGGRAKVFNYELITKKLITKLEAERGRVLFTQGRLKGGDLRFDIAEIDFDKKTVELIDLAPGADRVHIEGTKMYEKELRKLLPKDFTFITKEHHYVGAEGQVVENLVEVVLGE